jgi:predicted MPP superfamily phosphohydrolase
LFFLSADLAPRLGIFAAIGNHEHFRGLRETQRAYEKSAVPLLLEAGTTLKVGDASLFLGGADDPRVLSRQRPGFFDRTVKTVLDGAPSDAFRVPMSHRPEGFDAAAKEGVHLTLAGHTHGAQLGFGERSVFERLLPDSDLSGHYARDGAQLYTCSGAGPWFPFRIGCPREVPVLVLRRGPAGTAANKHRLA